MNLKSIFFLCFVFAATYKGRQEDNNKLWHASFDVTGAPKIVFENNAASGSERVGFKIRGKSCYQEDPDESWDGNVGHTTLHGIHIGYGDGLPGCLKIENFLLWKNWDYGVFAFPSSRVIVKNTIVADNTIGNYYYYYYYRLLLLLLLLLLCN